MAGIDEQAVKTRLLLDGDGGGDDRRLNMLAKQVKTTFYFQAGPIFVREIWQKFNKTFLAKKYNCIRL